MRNITTVFALKVIVVVAVTTGYVSNEGQGAKITVDIGASLGNSSKNKPKITGSDEK